MFIEDEIYNEEKEYLKVEAKKNQPRFNHNWRETNAITDENTMKAGIFWQVETNRSWIDPNRKANCKQPKII